MWLVHNNTCTCLNKVFMERALHRNLSPLIHRELLYTSERSRQNDITSLYFIFHSKWRNTLASFKNSTVSMFQMKARADTTLCKSYFWSGMKTAKKSRQIIYADWSLCRVFTSTLERGWRSPDSLGWVLSESGFQARL